MNLQSQCSFFESQVNLHSQRLYIYDELDSMGFGLTKLKIIRNTIKEIAAEENISFSQAVDKFFKFLEQRYDIKLRLKVLEEEEQQKKYTTKPDPSILIEKRQQRQIPSSISYTYRKITNASKKTEEQNDQLNNDHDDEWYGSDDDHSL